MHNEILPEPPQNIQSEADAQAVRLVTQRLNEITTRAKRANHLFSIRYGVLCGVLLGAIFLPFRSFGLDNPLCVPLVLLMFIVGIILLGLADRARARTMPVFDVAEITQIGGVKAIAPLWASMQNPIPYARKRAINETITLLLPELKASDAHLITPAFRRDIHTTLQHGSFGYATHDHYIARCIASLKALEQVGDSRDIPVVKKLTNMKPQTPEQEKIKQAAIECLPMLLANCGDVKAARTLLRASQSEDCRPDTLLRPANGATQTSSAELLRGSDAPDAVV